MSEQHLIGLVLHAIETSDSRLYELLPHVIVRCIRLAKIGAIEFSNPGE